MQNGVIYSVTLQIFSVSMMSPTNEHTLIWDLYF